MHSLRNRLIARGCRAAVLSRERQAVTQDAITGRAEPTFHAASAGAGWPPAIRSFWDSGEGERFGVSGAGGDDVE
jgi:hypothetical protein